MKKDIGIENAKIIFRNFAGREKTYNPAGVRNFCVVFDQETAEMLEKDGWNIKWKKPFNEDDDLTAYLQVSVSFNKYPPTGILVSGNKKTKLDEDTIELLDMVEIQTADVVIRPYNWEVSGKAGIKAYLKSIYVVMEEDEFASKYYDIPDDDVPF